MLVVGICCKFTTLFPSGVMTSEDQHCLKESYGQSKLFENVTVKAKIEDVKTHELKVLG